MISTGIFLNFFLLYLWILGMLSNIILVADCWSLSQLDTSWVDHQSITGQTQRDRQPLRLIPTVNLEPQINLACSVWTEGESWSTRLLSCRHQEGFWLTGGFRPRNFWLWGNGANYNTSVDSNWMFLFLIILLKDFLNQTWYSFNYKECFLVFSQSADSWNQTMELEKSRLDESQCKIRKNGIASQKLNVTCSVIPGLTAELLIYKYTNLINWWRPAEIYSTFPFLWTSCLCHRYCKVVFFK